jgi:hypothetical protein
VPWERCSVAIQLGVHAPAQMPSAVKDFLHVHLEDHVKMGTDPYAFRRSGWKIVRCLREAAAQLRSAPALKGTGSGSVPVELIGWIDWLSVPLAASCGEMKLEE